MVRRGGIGTVAAFVLLGRACGGDAVAPPPRTANRVEIAAPLATSPEPDQTPGPADGGIESRPQQPRRLDGVYVIGDEASATGYSMIIHAVEECVVPYYFKPKKGNVKLGVDVTIKATAGDVPVNRFYATIADAEGYRYTTTFGGCEPELQATLISTGERVRGFLTFEIPIDAKGLRMRYNPPSLGSDQKLEFDLGR